MTQRQKRRKQRQRRKIVVVQQPIPVVAAPRWPRLRKLFR